MPRLSNTNDGKNNVVIILLNNDYLQVARLRAMLDADEPFKPDQAYAYFINLKRGKKKRIALVEYTFRHFNTFLLYNAYIER